MIWGRLIGAVLGFLVAGSVGVLIGLFIGAVFDRGFVGQDGLYSKHQRFVRDVYFKTVFQIMGYVAKIDGRVTQDEIQTARMMMHRMNLNDRQVVQAIQFFRQGKAPNFNFDAAIIELYAACHNQPALLQRFIETQFQSASASGFNVEKSRLLETMCQRLHVTPMFHGYGEHAHYTQSGRRRQRSRQQHQHQSSFQPKSNLQTDYKTLEIEQAAPDAAVKKAYRKLISANHPDKLVSKGLSEADIKRATEKTQTIRRAYERIMAARGIR